MPKSRVAKSKKFREASPMKEYFKQDNPYKLLGPVFVDTIERYNIPPAFLYVMMYVYDLEFFTADYLTGKVGLSEKYIKTNLLGRMKREGWLYDQFAKQSTIEKTIGQAIHDERSRTYRNRYALSQRGRLLVRRVIRKMNGEEPIKPASDGI